MNLFFSPYPLGTIERPELLSGQTIRDLIRESRSAIREPGEFRGSVAFDYGQTTSDSAILRRRLDAPPSPNRGPAWVTGEFFVDGRAKFHVPLRYHDDLMGDALGRVVRSSRVRDALTVSLAGEPPALELGVRFFDLRRLWFDTATLIGYYLTWLGDDAKTVDVRFAVRIDRVWRSVALVDDDQWGEHVTEYGLPMMNTDTVRIPSEVDRGLSLVDLEDAPAWRMACELLGWAFGLPPEVHDGLIEATRRRPVLQ